MARRKKECCNASVDFFKGKACSRIKCERDATHKGHHRASVPVAGVRNYWIFWSDDRDCRILSLAPTLSPFKCPEFMNSDKYRCFIRRDGSVMFGQSPSNMNGSAVAKQEVVSYCRANGINLKDVRKRN